jgi:hypothetical protein
LDQVDESAAEQVCIGTATIILEHPLLRGQSQAEQQRIAKEFVAVLAERFDVYAQQKQWSVSADFEILRVRSGCIELKLKIVLLVVQIVGAVVTTAVAVIVAYPEIREAIPHIVKDAGALYRCVQKEKVLTCVAQAREMDLAKHLYQVKQGDTLSRIVTEEWRIAQERAHKFMVATVKQNPKAFVNGDMNQLKAGAILAKPTDNMVKEANPRQ